MAPPTFTIDTVSRALDKLPFSLPGAALIALYSFYKARAVSGPALKFLDHVRANNYLFYFLVFVAVKTMNRSLTRLVRNHGWKADPPKWSQVKGKGDIVRPYNVLSLPNPLADL